MMIMFKPLIAEGFTGDDPQFALDPRFWPAGDAPNGAHSQQAPGDDDPAQDPNDRARLEGYQRGWDDALAHIAEETRQQAEAQAALALSLSRLDAEQAARLAERLRLAVEALCRELIADIAIDRDLLARRSEALAALVAAANEACVMRLHPDDIPLLDEGHRQSWTILPDRTLERGAIRVEMASGGIEDTPQNWTRAVQEALGAC